MTKAIDLISSSFSTEKCSAYSLSIREFPNGFSFCVVDKSDNTCVAIKHTHTSLFKQIIEEEPLLQLPIAKTIIMAEAPFAIVPHIISDVQNKEQFLPIEPFQQKRAKIQAIDTAFDNQFIFDCRRFPQFQREFQPQQSLNVMLHILEQITERDAFLAEINDKQINIVVKKNNMLIFANKFNIEGVNDGAYFLLATFEQLELDPESMPITLCGNSQSIAYLLPIIKTYIRHIDKLKPDQTWPAQFNDEYFTHFATLIQANICE